MSGAAEFAVDDKVLAYSGVAIYPGKVVRVERTASGDVRYRVHYHGWKDTYDEWVAADRVLKADESGRKRMEQVNAEAKAAAKRAPKAKDSRSGASAKGKGGDADGAGAGAGSSAGVKRRAVDSAKEAEEGPAEGAIQLLLPAPLKQALVEDWELVTQHKYLPRFPAPGATAASVCAEYLRFLAEGEPEGGAGAGAGGDKPAAKKGRVSGAGAAAAAGSSSAAAGSAAGGGGGGKKGKAAARPAVPAASPEQQKAAREVIAAVQGYLDKALPVFLLYRFERLHFEAWRRDAERREGAGAGSSAGGRVSGKALSEVCPPVYLLRLLVKLPELLLHGGLTPEQADALGGCLSDFSAWLGRHVGTYFPREAYWKSSGEYATAFEAACAKSAGAPRIGLDRVFAPGGVTPKGPLLL